MQICLLHVFFLSRRHIFNLSSTRFVFFFLFAFPGSANQNVLQFCAFLFSSRHRELFFEGFFWRRHEEILLLSLCWADWTFWMRHRRRLQLCSWKRRRIFRRRRWEILVVTKAAGCQATVSFGNLDCGLDFQKKMNYGQRKLGKIIETNKWKQFLPPVSFLFISFFHFQSFTFFWFYSLNEKHKKDYSCWLWGQHTHSKHGVPITHGQYHLMPWIPECWE